MLFYRELRGVHTAMETVAPSCTQKQVALVPDMGMTVHEEMGRVIGHMTIEPTVCMDSRRQLGMRESIMPE